MRRAGALGQLLRSTEVREREVHVVAAEQEVVAHGDARQLERPALVGHRDQAEVGGAAADVAHERDVADPHELAPVLGVGLEPVVERRLRLLEQRHVRQPGLPRGLHGELARHGVEARRDRQHHLLVLQRQRGIALRDRVLPRLAQVPEDARRGLERRDLFHVVARAPRQDRRAPVHVGVAEPALRRGHEPVPDLRAVVARELADRVVAILGPGQLEAPRGQLVRAGM